MYDNGITRMWHGNISEHQRGITEMRNRERSGSVIVCLTQGRRVGSSSLTGVKALWSLRKTHLS